MKFQSVNNVELLERLILEVLEREIDESSAAGNDVGGDAAAAVPVAVGYPQITTDHNVGEAALEPQNAVLVSARCVQYQGYSLYMVLKPLKIRPPLVCFA